MFIETVPNRSSPPAILLRESYRDETGRAQKRTLANLSKLPTHVIEGVRALLKGAVVSPPGEPALQIERALPHGHVAAALGMVRQIALDRLLLSTAKDAGSKRARDLVVAMLVDRLVAPRSKLALARSLQAETATSSLGPVLGLGAVAEREVYAALDWLLTQQPRIEAGLARRHLKDGTLVLYDVSSSYVEGRKCPLARFGHSRDRRRDRAQIVYGLLCDRDGRPIAIEVFEGHTADPATLKSQVDRLKQRFKLSRVVLVGDRGLITSARLREDLQPAGLDWISCLRAPAIQELAAADGPLQWSLFDERDLAEISSPDDPGERLIVCRNPLLAAERARKREALLRATEKDLARLQAATQRARKPLRGRDAIGLRVGAVLDQHKMAKHFELDIQDGALSWRRKADSIAREAALDGIYVVRTSVPAEAMDAGQTVQAYKDLARVERAFRTLKSADLEIRPIHHWLSPRVRAHVFLCMLAYHVEWHLRAALAPILYAEHDLAAARAQRASPVAPAVPSPAAKLKRERRRTADQLPVLSFADLMRHLGTLTLNTVRAPHPGSHTFTLCARPTRAQQAAFDLLGIDPVRVQ
jgi:hypothetical protein